MVMTNAERVAAHRARAKAKTGRALTAIERKHLSLGRKQTAIEVHPLNDTEKHARFRDLIAQAQALAAEINREAMERLKATPLTRDTARMMDALEKETRYSFAQIYLPVE